MIIRWRDFYRVLDRKRNKPEMTINKNDIDLENLLVKSLQERKLLLENNPRLQQSQEQLDRLLLKAGGFNNRMSTLFYLIEANLYKMREQLKILDTILND